MTRNVTGFLFLSEIKMIIRCRVRIWRVEGGGIRQVKWFIVLF